MASAMITVKLIAISTNPKNNTGSARSTASAIAIKAVAARIRLMVSR